MSVQHLSDEAVAAFADGVLSGHARERAARHLSVCGECRQAVKVQREAALALRSASPPALPSALLDKLRSVPRDTPVTTLPTAIGPDGSTMLSTFAPMASFVPTTTSPGKHRTRPFLTAAALVGVAGALVAGSSYHSVASPPAGSAPIHPVNRVQPGSHPGPAVVEPVNLFRGARP